MRQTRLLNYILFVGIAVNMIDIIAMIYLIFTLPSPSTIHQHREVIFPQVIAKLQSQPADEARTNSLMLLEPSNRALKTSWHLINEMTRFFLGSAVINIGILTFCIYKVRHESSET
jgi:hypothetical protein